MTTPVLEPDSTDLNDERSVVVDLVAVEPEPVLVLLPEAALPRSQHPAAAYLQSLAPGSRRTMTLALNTLAALLTIPRQHDANGQNVTYLVVPWHHLRFQHTSALRAHLAERYAPATANRMLAALRQVLINARRLGLMGADDCANACDLKSVSGSRIPPGRVLEPGEINGLLEVCARDKREQGRRDGALIATLRSTGMRRSEIVGLRLADYTEEAAQVIIRAGKGNKDRIAYLHEGALAWLTDWLMLLGSVEGPIFVPIGKGGRIRRGTHLTDQSVRYILKERAREAGITRPFTAHDFRRTLISNLLESGIDIATVQRLVGHADVSTTSKYDRRGEQAKRRAIGALHIPHFQRSR